MVKCEMCNGELVKQDGLFVCQSCGTKYSINEVKKMMNNDVSTQNVNTNSMDELSRLYTAARNAVDTGDSATAFRHYERISLLDPNSWEALFYCVILQTEDIKNGEITNTALKIQKCLPKIFTLIKQSNLSEDEKFNAVKTVANKCEEKASTLISYSNNFCNSLNGINGVVALTGIFNAIGSALDGAKHVDEDRLRCIIISGIVMDVANLIEKNFNTEDDRYKTIVIDAYESLLAMETTFLNAHNKLGKFLFEPTIKANIQNSLAFYKGAEVETFSKSKTPEINYYNSNSDTTSKNEVKGGTIIKTIIVVSILIFSYVELFSNLSYVFRLIEYFSDVEIVGTMLSIILETVGLVFATVWLRKSYKKTETPIFKIYTIIFFSLGKFATFLYSTIAYGFEPLTFIFTICYIIGLAVAMFKIKN